MEILRKSSVRLFLIVAALGAVSCGTTRLEVPVTRPAEINTSKFKRVFVGDFKNATSLPNPQGKLEFALTNRLTASGKFDVIDKEAYEAFVKGNRGKNDDVLVINGTVSSFKGGEEIRKGEPYKDKAGKNYVDYTRIAAARYGVQFKVSQASDATIIATREIVKEASASQTATNQTPAHIDLEDLVKSAETDVIEEFMKKIIPYQERLQIEIYSDKELPELEQGIEAAKKGEWEQAAMLFKAATEKYPNAKTEQKAVAFYDLGLAYQFGYRFAEAKKALNKAISLDGSNQRYKAALNECNFRETEYKKVLEQSGASNR